MGFINLLGPAACAIMRAPRRCDAAVVIDVLLRCVLRDRGVCGGEDAVSHPLGHAAYNVAGRHPSKQGLKMVRCDPTLAHSDNSVKTHRISSIYDCERPYTNTPAR